MRRPAAARCPRSAAAPRIGRCLLRLRSLATRLCRSSARRCHHAAHLPPAPPTRADLLPPLPPRSYEVNRLELMLSMGSFAAALGAMIAGIFGMNMRSTLELSIAGFWGVTGAIVVGCFYIFLAIMRYTQRKRIL